MGWPRLVFRKFRGKVFPSSPPSPHQLKHQHQEPQQPQPIPVWFEQLARDAANTIAMHRPPTPLEFMSTAPQAPQTRPQSLDITFGSLDRDFMTTALEWAAEDYALPEEIEEDGEEDAAPSTPTTPATQLTEATTPTLTSSGSDSSHSTPPTTPPRAGPTKQFPDQFTDTEAATRPTPPTSMVRVPPRRHFAGVVASHAIDHLRQARIRGPAVPLRRKAITTDMISSPAPLNPVVTMAPPEHVPHMSRVAKLSQRLHRATGPEHTPPAPSRVSTWPMSTPLTPVDADADTDAPRPRLARTRSSTSLRKFATFGQQVVSATQRLLRVGKKPPVTPHGSANNSPACLSSTTTSVTSPTHTTSRLSIGTVGSIGDDPFAPPSPALFRHRSLSRCSASMRSHVPQTVLEADEDAEEWHSATSVRSVPVPR